MTKNRTLEEKLHSRKLKQPNSIWYFILMQIIKILNKKDNLSFNIITDPSKEPGPIVMIANHSTRAECNTTAPPCYPKKLNFVVGYNEFFRFPLGILLRSIYAIPKKNFTPDIYSIRQIVNIVKNGGSICIMPEGMNSITGMSQPVAIGTGKLLKKLGVPVYYSKISGGYLTYTKHYLDARKGKIEVSVDEMFSAEDIAKMSTVEIEDTMNHLLAHDEYMWNKKEQIRFNGKGQMAKNLDTLLYLCPKCGSMYQMETNGNTMKCKSCGNTITIDEYYNIKAADKNSECPELVTDWTIMERTLAYNEVRENNFSFSEHVKLGVLPNNKFLFGDKTSIIVGDGILTLDKNGLHFNGTKKGESFSFDLSTEQVPTFGMCTDISRFYTFVNNEFIEFYPDNNDVLRWLFLTEEMHRANGGKWQNTNYRHNDN